MNQSNNVKGMAAIGVKGYFSGMLCAVLTGGVAFAQEAGSAASAALAPTVSAPTVSAPAAAAVPAATADAAASALATAVPATVPLAAPTVDAASTAAAVSAVLPHDLTPWGMFQAASPVVQAVMIGLALASVATWTVWLAKTIELRVAKGRLRSALTGLEQLAGLRELPDHAAFRRGPAAEMVRAAVYEKSLSEDGSAEGLKERVESRLSRIEAAAARRVASGTGLLASIGSVGPFVGLFGTVWGIMTAFIGISKAHTTNLAVVAPGIAEALLATAIGLVAAIPAVVIYNILSRAIGGYRAQLGDTAASVLRHVSRDLDRQDREAAMADQRGMAGAKVVPVRRMAAE